MTLEGVFTLAMRGRLFDVSVNFDVEPTGEIFDVSPGNDHASPNVKNPFTRRVWTTSKEVRWESRPDATDDASRILCEPALREATHDA